VVQSDRQPAGDRIDIVTTVGNHTLTVQQIPG
jgi:hypothetical protein